MSLCPLLIVNLRILGLILWGSTHFVQNNYCPTWRHSTNYERVAWLWHQIRGLEAQNVPWFSLLQSDMGFKMIIPFRENFMSFQVKKIARLNTFFLLTYVEFKTAEFFPPAESRLVNSNFSRVSSLQSRFHVLGVQSRKFQFSLVWTARTAKAAHVFTFKTSHMPRP